MSEAFAATDPLKGARARNSMSKRKVSRAQVIAVVDYAPAVPEHPGAGATWPVRLHVMPTLDRESVQDFDAGRAALQCRQRAEHKRGILTRADKTEAPRALGALLPWGGFPFLGLCGVALPRQSQVRMRVRLPMYFGTSIAGRKGAEVTPKRTACHRARRVLVVGPIPPPLHGVTVMTEALLDGVVGTDWDFVHVDTSDHRSIDNIGRFDLRNVVLAIRHVARFARMMWRTRPDIVYLPLSFGLAGFTRDAAFLIAARVSSAHVVVHAHGGQYHEFYRRMPAAARCVMRFCLARVQLIIVLSEAQRSQFDGWAPRGARVAVVPNGVRDEWSACAPKRVPREGGMVLFLGNLMVQKGFLDVLDAVPIVLRTVPRARFVFAGRPAWDADTAALVSARLREPEVESATAFVGVVWAAERRRLLEDADILVFAPRWHEGQGLVALEAMSAGLPIVATASGGLAETVRNDHEAIVVPGQDPAAIAVAITRLLQDPALRARLGAAGRERYEHEYTLDRWASRMAEAFEAVVQGP